MNPFLEKSEYANSNVEVYFYWEFFLYCYLYFQICT